MDAIQISGYSDPEVDKRLAEIGDRWGDQSPDLTRIILFGCQRSAGRAWEEAQGAGFEAQGEVKFIGLPCAGKIDPDHLLKALSTGAAGVLVLACPEENCRSLHGNTYARERMAEAKHYLEEAGINPDRIRFGNLSSNMGWYLKEVVNDFSKQLTDTGA
jgi:coenzyme F420-reducing hydrogenase delta subunit